MEALCIEYIFIKKEDDICKSVKGFNNLLKSDINISINNKTLTYKRKEFQYKLHTSVVETEETKKERYFNLTITRKLESQADNKVQKGIDEINEVRRAIIKVLSKADFKQSLLWDDITNYYSSKAYPLIHNVENKMRKLITKFMLTNIGTNWLERATPHNVIEEIKKKADKNNIRDYLMNALFEADFIHLSIYIFKPYATISNEDLEKILEATESVDQLNLEEIKEFVPKSNWDRYFSEIIKDEALETKWNKLYKLRNMIAHNKPISKGEYDEIVKLHGLISKNLEKAIGSLEEIEISDDEKQALSKQVISDFIEKGATGFVSYINVEDQPNYISGELNLANAVANHGFVNLVDDKKCVTCNKYYSSSPYSVDFTNQCEECRNKSLVTVFAGHRSCTECGKLYESNPLDVRLTNKCPDCENGLGGIKILR
ncbi:hypothetical protein [Fulvivirga sp.]|uniref:hypothetical protein n=1 Tax=Fulvivirga sp. TaxID=1931237 RepID=UPI0032EE9DC8